MREENELWRESLLGTFYSDGIMYTFEEWCDRETKEVVCLDCGRTFKTVVPKKCPAGMWKESCGKCLYYTHRVDGM